MTSGGLNGQLVEEGFCPECKNCTYYHQCEEADRIVPRRRGESMGARHPAFPSKWQWAAETVSFPEGVLVLISWVGADIIGAPSTGCPDYQVASHVLHPLQEKHRFYLELDEEKRVLWQKLKEYDARGVYDRHVDRLCERYLEIALEQSRLTILPRDSVP